MAISAPSDHEFTRHFTACIFVVSSSHADPMAQFAQLTLNQNQQQVHPLEAMQSEHSCSFHMHLIASFFLPHWILPSSFSNKHQQSFLNGFMEICVDIMFFFMIVQTAKMQGNYWVIIFFKNFNLPPIFSWNAFRISIFLWINPCGQVRMKKISAWSSLVILTCLCRAEAVYQSMKAKYGVLTCHLLKINTVTPNIEPGTASETFPDPWSNYIRQSSVVCPVVKHTCTCNSQLKP